MSHLTIQITNINKNNSTVTVRVNGGNNQIVSIEPGRFQDFLATGYDIDANPGKIEELLGVINAAMGGTLVALQQSTLTTPIIDQLLNQTIDFGRFILR